MNKTIEISGNVVFFAFKPWQQLVTELVSARPRAVKDEHDEVRVEQSQAVSA